MNYIERYLYELSSYLPKENKEDILKEVEANIYDMLVEDHSDENVIGVLKQMGSPRKLSIEYHGEKRYFIGPMYFDSYLKTVKFVIKLSGVIFGLIAIISHFFKNLENMTFSVVMEVFGITVGAVIQGVIFGAVWVTAIYVIIEHSNLTFDGKKIVKKIEWSPKMLKEIPNKSKLQYKKKDNLLIDIALTTIFTIIFISSAKYIGLYENGTLTAPLFNMDRFKVYIVILVVMLIFYIIVHFKILLSRYVDFKTSILKSIYSFINMIIFIMFISDNQLFNPGFRIEMIRVLSIEIHEYDNIVKWVTRLLIVIILIGTSADIFRVNYLAYKNS